jgi:hypothetical protein
MVWPIGIGGLCYHNCCIDGSTSLEYFGYHLVSGHEILVENFADGQESFYNWQISIMKFGSCAKKLRDAAMKQTK